jgi:hypothetical protein
VCVHDIGGEMDPWVCCCCSSQPVILSFCSMIRCVEFLLYYLMARLVDSWQKAFAVSDGKVLRGTVQCPLYEEWTLKMTCTCIRLFQLEDRYIFSI